MPTDNLYPAILNLDEYDVFIDENVDNSNYINIEQLSKTFGYGKHYFLLSWKRNSNSEYQIKNGSKILFEFKDRDGNIIFSELTNTLPINGAAVCYVWVKKNPLRLIGDRWEISDGVCSLRVVYQLEGGSINHSDIIYGRSTFEFEIKKKIPNTSPILFYSGSQISGGLSISESLDLDGDVASPYKRSYLHISNSFMRTDGGKVEFIELSYIENNSAASGSAFKSLTTYKLSASGDFFEVPSNFSDGLNPLSHIHKVATPREMRRNRPVTFKLRFLNSSKDVAKDISENSDVELRHTMHVSGSPLILEGQDNLVHSSASLGFGDSIEKSIRLQLTKDVLDSPRLSFKEFNNDVEVKEVGRIDAGKEQYTFGDLSSNDIEGNSSGSSIIGGFHNLITGSRNSSIIGSTGSHIISSSISSILGGKNHKISLPITPAINNLSMNLMIGGNTNAITGSTIESPTDNIVLGGSSNQISIGTFNTIIGGLGNKILSQSTGGGRTAEAQHNLILASTFGFIRYGTRYSSILASQGNGLGNDNFIGDADTDVVGSAIIACGNGNEIKHRNSVILGMENKTTTATNTIYVQNLFADGNLNVSGTLTAKEFHTEFTSASIIYESGSTKFGDSIDDIHNITGSVYISGSTFHTGSTFNIGSHVGDNPGDGVSTLNVSGSISASGAIKGGSLDINGTADFGDNNITNVGTIDVDLIRADAATSVEIGLSAGGIDLIAEDGDTFTINSGEINADFIYYDSTETELIVGDAALSRVKIGGTAPTSKLHIDGDLKTNSNITASGEISASGAIKGTAFHGTDGVLTLTFLGTDFFGAATSPTEVQGTSIILDGPVTASGNISASGFVSASSFAGDGAGLTNVSATVSPAGSDTQVQFNDDGSLAGDAGFTYDKTSNSITAITNITASGNISASGTITTINTSSFGAVGVNKLNPTTTLEIEGSVSASGDLYLESNKKIYLATNDTSDNFIQYGAAGDHIEIQSQDVHFDVANGVGIKTNSPSKTLTVEGDISASGDLFIAGTPRIGQSSDRTFISSSDDINLHSGDDIFFKSSGTAIMTVDGGNQRVGIGTTLPTKKLTVEGDISASGTHFADTGSFNSLVAPGSIIGYTSMYPSAAGRYDTTTSFAVIEDNYNSADHYVQVTFEVPPSNKVEIETFLPYVTSADGTLHLGLATATDATTLDAKYEQVVWDVDESDLIQIVQKWTIYGSDHSWSVGDSITLFTMVKEGVAGARLFWGDSVVNYGNIIMKATALPAITGDGT